MEEIDKLLKGANSENTVGSVEYDPNRQVAFPDSTSPVEITSNLDDFDLLVTSSLHVLDMKIFPNSLEDQAAEGGMDGDFQHVHVACLDTIMQADEDIPLEEEENARVRRDDADNPFIESRITKPRARVFTNYEVMKFKEGGVQKRIQENGVKKKKMRKREIHAAEDDATRKKREELRRAYKKKIHAYKTKYKPQKIRRAFPMQENEET